MTLVKDEIGRLWDEQRATLNRLDMHEQDLACCGIPVEADAETKRLRKYDSDLSREWRWAYDQLFKLRSDPSRLAKVEAKLAKCPLPVDGMVSERVEDPVAPSNTPVMIEDDADQLIWSDAEALASAMAELEAMEQADDEEAAEEETPAGAGVGSDRAAAVGSAVRAVGSEGRESSPAASRREAGCARRRVDRPAEGRSRYKTESVRRPEPPARRPRLFGWRAGADSHLGTGRNPDIEERGARQTGWISGRIASRRVRKIRVAWVVTMVRVG